MSAFILILYVCVELKEYIAPRTAICEFCIPEIIVVIILVINIVFLLFVSFFCRTAIFYINYKYWSV